MHNALLDGYQALLDGYQGLLTLCHGQTEETHASSLTPICTTAPNCHTTITGSHVDTPSVTDMC